MNVIFKKLKAYYFLEWEAKRTAPSPFTSDDGLALACTMDLSPLTALRVTPQA